MVSRKFSQKIEKIKKWQFLFQAMLVINVVIDLKTSSERASGNNPYNPKSYKEN